MKVIMRTSCSCAAPATEAPARAAVAPPQPFASAHLELSRTTPASPRNHFSSSRLFSSQTPYFFQYVPTAKIGGGEPVLCGK